MSELFSQLNSDHVFVLTIVGSGLVFLCIASLGPVLAWQWRQVREKDAATELVYSMLQEGKSVEEIERVLKAGGFGQQSTEFASMKFGCSSKRRKHRFARTVQPADHA